ncbi:hypothetical protein RB597_006432 [Gaeumannomyces tritici]
MNTQQPMYQAGSQAFQPVAINKVVASKGWYIAKLTLGSCIALFDIILIALSAAYMNLWTGYNGSGNSYFILVFIPAIVSLGWQIAEFITVGVHKDRRGIHPGAHVALHLLLWLTFAMTVTLLGFLVSRRIYLRNGNYGYSSRFMRFLNDGEPLENAQFAFSVLNLILHFTLFVRFCIETNRRNTLPPGMIMVAAPASGMYLVPGAQPQYMAQAVPQQPQAGQASAYGGFYAPQAQPVDKAVVEQQQQQQPTAAPVATAV